MRARQPRLRTLSSLLGLAVVASALSAVAATPAQAAGFTPGNLVVVRVGNGTPAGSGIAAPVFLDEYTPAGGLVQTIPLPTTTGAAGNALTLTTTATSEGALASSPDGRYLTLMGYEAAPTTAVAGTRRVVGRIDASGTVDTTTTSVDSGTPRGAVTDDGNRLWTATNNGVRATTLGATTSDPVSTVNARVPGIADGQLYVSSAGGVNKVGSGLPTTSGQAATLVAAGASSAYGYVFLDRDAAVAGVDSLYIADDSAAGGILKYSFDGSTWTARGSFRPSSAGARGLSGSVQGDGTVSLATSTTINTLATVTDSAAYNAPISATAITVATAATATVFRGVVQLAGTPPPTAPSITAHPQDTTVPSGGTATLTVGASGTAPLSYQWYEGTAPDTTTPVGTDNSSFTTPALTSTTSYWVRVTNAAGTADSTTATVTVAALCSAADVAIGAVQGSGDVTPMPGTVTVQGTVVGDYEGASPALRGFYLQDAGDSDTSTSDGIFVFDGSNDLVSNGDVVQVTGTASEFQGQTQVSTTAAGLQECGATASVTPTDVTLPRASATDLEPYEGMLVRMHQTLTVTEHFQLGRFGQVVVSSGGKLPQPTAYISAADQPAVQAQQAANNLNHIIIDDATQAQNPDPIVFGRGGQPLSASNTLRGGDTVTDPVGVMTYTWAGNAASGNAYRLRPLQALGGAAVFDPANPRPATIPDVGTGGIKVASANLLNFFNTFSGCTFGVGGAPADCRGAENTTEYDRQLAKEVASLTFLQADVIGFMEMENDGYGAGSAEQALVNALNAQDGAGTWAFVDFDAATGVTNVAGDDAIKAGLLYKTASVTPVAGKTFVDQNALFERQPVGQTFQGASGARVTVIANHFKSKGSCPATGPDTDQGDGQSCWNAHRTDQANELAGWIQSTVVPSAGDPDVLIVGDLNSYAGEDPIRALESAGFTNLPKAFHGDEAYSYAFDGQWGYLDYVLGSASVVPQVTGAGDVHNNADEPAVLDYNTNFKTPGQVASLYAPDRFRNSDHDPVLVGLDIGAPASISGTPPAATVATPYSFAFTIGGTPPVTVSLTSGALPPGLSLAADGTVSGTPTAAGTYPFTVHAANAYGGADLATSITVDRAATTLALTSSANPSSLHEAVTFTATVSSPGGTTPTGTVQFSADGVAVGGPVPLVGVSATSAPISSPAAGGHAITATYSGDTNFAGSDAALTQVVRYVIRVSAPTAGARFKTGSTVPVKFTVTDVNGVKVDDATAASLITAPCRLTVSATGVQTLAPKCPTYDSSIDVFQYNWKTAKNGRGAVTVTVSLSYPGVSVVQVVSVPITLT